MTNQGPVVEETSVRLVASATQLFAWRCTPTDLAALALGRLYIEGMVDSAVAADRLVTTQKGDEYEIVITGPLGITRAPAQRALQIPSAEQFNELFRALFAGVEERHESGGMHAVALADGERIVFQAEDVGRHNTVDKVIGMALLGGADIAAHGLLVSSRVSGEIARKAAQAGVAWLASRSIPTTLAVREACAATMPIIGRAAGKNAHVYQ